MILSTKSQRFEFIINGKLKHNVNDAVLTGAGISYPSNFQFVPKHFLSSQTQYIWLFRNQTFVHPVAKPRSIINEVFKAYSISRSNENCHRSFSESCCINLLSTLTLDLYDFADVKFG